MVGNELPHLVLAFAAEGTVKKLIAVVSRPFICLGSGSFPLFSSYLCPTLRLGPALQDFVHDSIRNCLFRRQKSVTVVIEPTCSEVRPVILTIISMKRRLMSMRIARGARCRKPAPGSRGGLVDRTVHWAATKRFPWCQPPAKTRPCSPPCLRTASRRRMMNFMVS